MNGPQKRQPQTVQVQDPAAAMRRMQDLGRKILAVPKSEVDTAVAKEKAGKKPKHR